MKTKAWYTSKTLWANALVIMLGIQQNLASLEGVIDAKVFGVALITVGIINGILRAVTDSAIK